jgi:hypothetical protein
MFAKVFLRWSLLLIGVKIMWVIPHPETGVACSRNSPPSPPGRPSPLLLDRALSEPTGVATSCINPSLFLLRLQQLRSTMLPLKSTSSRSLALPRSASTPTLLLVTLVTYSPSLFSAGFLCFRALKSLLQYTRSIVGLVFSPYLEI